MRYAVYDTDKLDGTVLLPASKSIGNRALLICACTPGAVWPGHLSDADDTRVLQEALAAPADTTDIHGAGTAMRFLTAYYSTLEGTRVLTGNARMRQRPIAPLVDALRTLGADIRYTETEGCPPLQISGGGLRSVPLTLPGHISSQYVSALLLIGPLLPQGLSLQLTGRVVSRPYVDMTLSLMRHYGAEAGWSDAQTLYAKPGAYRPAALEVESDWSAASYWYELVALRREGCVRLPRLYRHSWQGDARVAELFARLGVGTAYTSEGVVLQPAGSMADSLACDLGDVPDLAQTLVVTCCLLRIPFIFTGLGNLRIKETDRLAALQAELRKLGFVAEITPDTISWQGACTEPSSSPVVNTYDDHRMAMAFAPAAVAFPGLLIDHPEVVAKILSRLLERP